MPLFIIKMLQGIFMHSLIMHLTWLVKSTAAFLKPYLAALKTYQVILRPFYSNSGITGSKSYIPSSLHL